MPTSVRLTEETEKRLTALAAKTGRSKASFIREAVMRHIENLEDCFLAAEAFEEFKISGEKSLSSEEARARLGLED